ncbi:DUF1761 domain-containing protein [Virgibacillus flavescens]|uniref:DUF1761 domain-containing protein n=1 Tax=Virgibacillus flavescens TaxID=1611422 RepID=UPI003D336B6F
MLIDLTSINYLPVIVGGIVYMMYGGIYYSILLSDKKANTRDIKKTESKGPFKYIYSVIIAFIISFFMAVLVQSIGADNLINGKIIGLVIGLLISMVYLKNALFGLISKKALIIAIGDHLVIFTLLGIIHGWLI